MEQGSADTKIGKCSWLLAVVVALLIGCQPLAPASTTSTPLPPTPTSVTVPTPTPRPARDPSTRPIITADNAGQVVELTVLQGHTAPPFDVVCSSAGDVLASKSGDGSVRLGDVRSGAELVVLGGPRGFAKGVVFSPDGRLLFAGCSDGTLRVWGVD